MAEEKINGVTAEAPKKHRRGISNETQAVSQLKFHEKDAANNGLFIGHLAEVRVDWSVASENSSFAGLKMPRLSLHFASNHANVSEQRHLYQTLFAIESNVSTIPGGSEEWRVSNVFNWIKHILDIYYLKGRNLTDDEVEALALPFEDYDEENQYVAVDPEVVLKGYSDLFNNVVAMLEGRFNVAEGETPKCYYKTADGKPISVWMKLLRHRKTKKGWINVGQNGELAFDSFIGAGAIEIVKGNNPPAILRIDLSKESITPKETKKEPTLGGQGMPNMMGGAVVGGMLMDMGTSMNGAFEAAGDAMPF